MNQIEILKSNLESKEISQTLLPTNQVARFWKQSQEIEADIIQDRYKELFAEHVNDIISNLDEDQANHTVKEIRKTVRKLQGTWKRSWGRQRGQMISKALGIGNVIHLRHLENMQRVPIELILCQLGKKTNYGDIRKVCTYVAPEDMDYLR